MGCVSSVHKSAYILNFDVLHYYENNAILYTTLLTWAVNIREDTYSYYPVFTGMHNFPGITGTIKQPTVHPALQVRDPVRVSMWLRWDNTCITCTPVVRGVNVFPGNA